MVLQESDGFLGGSVRESEEEEEAERGKERHRQRRWWGVVWSAVNAGLTRLAFIPFYHAFFRLPILEGSDGVGRGGT